MKETVETFQEKRTLIRGHLSKLEKFLKKGKALDIAIEQNLLEKLENAQKTVNDDKLKVALIGGFSEGKTSIAAAWMERLDKSSMNITHQESSNEVKVYEVEDDLVLIDTPGLFGFKEQENLQTHEIEKFKDITKKYVSEAHLVLYVMNSTNPIKESHYEDLNWLFRTLNLLPRTIFILSRFDEVVDVEDLSEYEDTLLIKQKNVAERLSDSIKLTDEEKSNLAIVGIAANPFDQGTEYWLDNLDEFRKLSHIASLQKNTAEKIGANGGFAHISLLTQQSIISDVLKKQIPQAIENDNKIKEELKRLVEVNEGAQSNLQIMEKKIIQSKVSLREFITPYFSDLILQAKGASLDTFVKFYERSVGDEGIIISTKLQNEFDKNIGLVNLEVNKIATDFDSEINHFNNMVGKYGKQGTSAIIKSGVINNHSILAARDGISATAKYVGINLGELLKFKPWGAVNLAKGLNGALAFAGIAMEAWDSYSKHQKEQEFISMVNDMVKSFEGQRKELLDLMNSPDFSKKFFQNYTELNNKTVAIAETVRLNEEKSEKLHKWRSDGEVIEAEFKELVTPS